MRRTAEEKKIYFKEMATEKLVLELHQEMAKMPNQMRVFSRGLRFLFAELAVGRADSAANFRQVRDAVRCDATVYVSIVLPLANLVILNISEYFDNYLALGLDDWKESLADIIKEVEGYENSCIFLTQMHESLVSSLNKRQIAAEKSLNEIKNCADEQDENVEKLHLDAIGKVDSAQSWEKWGDILALPTLGLSTIITDNLASSSRAEAQKNLARITALQANAEVGKQAAEMTHALLIPAVKGFLEGLSMSQVFFDETRSRLMNATEEEKNKHFEIMKMNSAGINAVCKTFFRTIAEVGYM